MIEQKNTLKKYKLRIGFKHEGDGGCFDHINKLAMIVFPIDIKKEYPHINVVINDQCVDKRTYKVSGEKAYKMLGFTPHISIKEGIREMIKYV